eukprot:2969824-Pyramimonas_sp.AAC.1
MSHKPRGYARRTALFQGWPIRRKIRSIRQRTYGKSTGKIRQPQCKHGNNTLAGFPGRTGKEKCL